VSPLPTHRWGRGATALLWLHGFTGDSSALGHLEPLLGEAVSAVCPDLPGHGQAAAWGQPGEGATERALDALLDLLRSLPRPRLLGGYSQGARIALLLAARAPDELDGLLCESGHSGLSGIARAQRAEEDERLALLLEEEGLGPFLARWESNPVLAGLLHLPAQLRRQLEERRRAQDPRGLALALRLFGQGSLPACCGELGRIRAPALLCAGEEDLRYTAHARSLAEALPEGRLRLFPCGHAPHLESPEPFARAILQLSGST
jgi:2-succinyl-6-hydroxy-2,4-cyclohexadiene-1-carboxylate synthase